MKKSTQSILDDTNEANLSCRNQKLFTKEIGEWDLNPLPAKKVTIFMERYGQTVCRVTKKMSLQVSRIANMLLMKTNS
jgi:hypothetical protein